MTFDNVKEMQIGSKKVKEAWLNGMQVYPSAKRIMDSLVCWYDPGKQQCTNESMAANPVLTDLSGNGHDIECFNFGWSGMSGIGGYNWTYNNFSTKDNFEHTDESVTLVNSDKTTFEKLYKTPNSNIVKGQKIKVSGINGNAKIVAYVQASNNKYNPLAVNAVTITENGEYDIADLDLTEIENVAYVYQGFKEISIPEGVTVKIENIPLYPNALVSDGVDDYAQVTGLPLLTKERGYTVIAKRKLLNFPFTKSQTLAMKGDRVTNNAQAFSFERYFNSGRPNISVSFGTVEKVSINNDDLISYQTSVSYNGEKIIKGNHIDEDILTIFGHKNSGYVLDYCSAALYSFLLFDRDLTTAEIEWVKQNMIEGDLVLPSQELDPSLIDAWIFSGLRNEDAPASIIGEKGIPLTCHNFAWNEEGSGFKDGALWFDGVDDSCIEYNNLKCDRNVTVIGKRKLTTDEYNEFQSSLNIHISVDLSPIIFLDYYESGFESAHGYKMVVIFGDYDLYYNNDTDPHTFWATKDSFNGEKYVNKRTNLEDGKKYNYNIYLGRVWSGPVSACAWYYLAVYDKVMTEQEAQFEIEKLEKIWSNRLNNN